MDRQIDNQTDKAMVRQWTDETDNGQTDNGYLERQTMVRNG